ncbi:MAG: Hsp70 family protein [Bacteroidetes bacterium]|nr:Hsp70 family protein [Bacteroidota bacterium]
MNFHKWSGSESEFSHEHDQIIELTRVVQEWSEKTNKVVHLLTNFYVQSEEIDACIILPNKVVVIDVKSGSGEIIGSENGDWLCVENDSSRYTINPNRKNPLYQARIKRFAIMNYFNSRKEEIFSYQKATQMSFEHTSSYIVFTGDIQWDKGQVPNNVLPWFDVISIKRLSDKLSSIRSKVLSLTNEEAVKIPTLLNLKYVEQKTTSNHTIKIEKVESSPKRVTDKQIPKKYKYAVGIDLGTTNSNLCYIDLLSNQHKINELPVEQTFPNQREITDTKVPSVVYIKDSQIFVGKGAEEKKYSAIRDRNVFYSSKSQLGQKHIYHLSKSGDVIYPYQVSGLVLKILFDTFKENIYDDIDKCKFVITVPASFGGSQRSDTIKAIEYSGIPVEEGMLVDEPNAAFIGYIKQLKQVIVPEGARILVFDMGGGTTDISILEVNSLEGNSMDIRNLAVSRYDLLGGDDIDAHIAYEYLYKIFLNQNNIDNNEFGYATKEKIVISKLKKIAKSLKEGLVDKLNWHLVQNGLSFEKEIDWDILPDFSNIKVTMPDEEIPVKSKKYEISDISLDLQLFKELINPFLSVSSNLDSREITYNKLSIFTVIKSIMDVASLNSKDIDFVLPIGGSPRNPLVVEALKNYFSSADMLIPSYRDIDLLVSKGAAFYAQDIAIKSTIPITPIIPDNIGILTHGANFSAIIKAGVEVPFPVEDDTFVKSEVLIVPDNSDMTTIPICIGDRSRIYQVVRIETKELERSVKLGMRVDKDKMLKMKIHSGKKEIPYEFKNPVTIYKSSNYYINCVNENRYTYHNAKIQNDDSADAKQLLFALSLKDAKCYEEAFEHFEYLSEKASDLDIINHSIFYTAYCASAMNDLEKAIEYYHRGLDNYPDDPTIMLNLGLIYFHNNQKEQAKAIWKKSIDNNNALNSTYINVGKLMIDVGDNNIQEATKLLAEGITKVLTKEPKTRFDMRSLIISYECLDDEENAQKWRDKLYDLDKNERLEYNLNELLQQEIEEVEL